MRINISFDLKELFNKAFFYLEWSKNCKNKKTKEKLIKKALKEVKNISREEARRKIKIEF